MVGGTIEKFAFLLIFLYVFYNNSGTRYANVAVLETTIDIYLGNTHTKFLKKYWYLHIPQMKKLGSVVRATS